MRKPRRRLAERGLGWGPGPGWPQGRQKLFPILFSQLFQPAALPGRHPPLGTPDVLGSLPEQSRSLCIQLYKELQPG